MLIPIAPNRHKQGEKKKQRKEPVTRAERREQAKVRYYSQTNQYGSKEKIIGNIAKKSWCGILATTTLGGRFSWACAAADNVMDCCFVSLDPFMR